MFYIEQKTDKYTNKIVIVKIVKFIGWKKKGKSPSRPPFIR
jgi:hypothetical protein